jgi:hypothetical protein
MGEMFLKFGRVSACRRNTNSDRQILVFPVKIHFRHAEMRKLSKILAPVNLMLEFKKNT